MSILVMRRNAQSKLNYLPPATSHYGYIYMYVCMYPLDTIAIYKSEQFSAHLHLPLFQFSHSLGD